MFNHKLVLTIIFSIALSSTALDFLEDSNTTTPNEFNATLSKTFSFM